MINYVHPARRPACNAPTLAEITEARFTDLRDQGYAIARSATATAVAWDTLPYEAYPLPRTRLTRRGRYALALLGFMVAFTLGWFGITPTAMGTPVQGAPDVTCHEDMPCWEWPTMGNMERAVILKGAPDYLVVDAAQYCYLRKAGLIDRKRTRPLKGDGLAKRKGCDVRYFAQPIDA